MELPVDAVIPDLRAALASAGAAVLEAPPGAGKTTRVPLALLGEAWLGGRTILMLEPRRIAARAAAARMAATLGEKPGETVGYRVRHEAKVGPATRIEVLTEALLTRRMQSDPELSGVGLVIFDEFHERSLDADLGLALALEAQAALRPDLKLLVMSATLDGARVAALLGGAPVIRSEGRLFPVETIWAPPSDPAFRALPKEMARLILRAHRDTPGGILAFLPGEGEIRAVARELETAGLPAGTHIAPLFGNLPFDAQASAIAPAAPGTRKIVLATAIAETSLTIEGISAVVDSGFSRAARHDPASGMGALVTIRTSRASADQRRGRAGRTGPGTCYRLWAEETHRAREAFAAPEIATADLAPFLLELAAWGEADPAAYALLDQPQAASILEARALLVSLGALDGQGRMTPHGRALSGLGVHPRLGHMIVAGAERGMGASAAALAAILSERDIVRTSRDHPDTDIRARLEVFAGGPPPFNAQIDKAALARARENARAWGRRARLTGDGACASHAGMLLALAYPERVAMARGSGGFRMRSGRGAVLAEGDPLRRERFLALGPLDGGGDNARVHLAAPLTLPDIEALFGAQIETREEVRWAGDGLVARQVRALGALILAERTLERPDAGLSTEAVLDGVRAAGLDALPWTEDLRQLQARAAFLRAQGDEAMPDLSDAALLGTLAGWLGPFLAGITRRGQFARIDLDAALKAHLGYDAARRLERDAPARLTVPTGNSLRVDYLTGAPVLEVKLQEMFGAADGPRVAQGRVPVTLHLLSPARRPVAVTQDLRGFWARGYFDVRKDLRGRYPKHPWPDDPLAAAPTARVKPRGS
jgi:ATP-dependent helicase HrpB